MSHIEPARPLPKKKWVPAKTKRQGWGKNFSALGKATHWVVQDCGRLRRDGASDAEITAYLKHLNYTQNEDGTWKRPGTLRRAVTTLREGAEGIAQGLTPRIGDRPGVWLDLYRQGQKRKKRRAAVSAMVKPALRKKKWLPPKKRGK